MVRYGPRTDSQRVIIIASLEWGAKERRLLSVLRGTKVDKPKPEIADVGQI
jgi:hypothetical protein